MEGVECGGCDGLGSVWVHGRAWGTAAWIIGVASATLIVYSTCCCYILSPLLSRPVGSTLRRQIRSLGAGRWKAHRRLSATEEWPEIDLDSINYSGTCTVTPSAQQITSSTPASSLCPTALGAAD